MKLKDILDVPIESRSEKEKFYLKMYLKTNVPFFGNYSGTVLQNIAGVLK